jgi:hypothetical protein
MKWRTLFGLSGSSDFWTAERVRDSATNTVIGGRIALTDAAAAFGYKDTTAATQDAILTMFSSGVTQLSKSRYEVYAPASSSSALYATADSGHTGNLLRLSVAAVDKLTVDKDGNTTAAGTITAASSSTTTGLTAASGFTINSGGFYGYRFGKVVAIDLYMHRSGTTITSTSGNLTDVAIATLPAGWRPTHNTINGAWDDGTTFGGWVVGTDGICTLRTAYAEISGPQPTPAHHLHPGLANRRTHDHHAYHCNIPPDDREHQRRPERRRRGLVPHHLRLPRLRHRRPHRPGHR